MLDLVEPETLTTAVTEAAGRTNETPVRAGTGSCVSV